MTIFEKNKHFYEDAALDVLEYEIFRSWKSKLGSDKPLRSCEFYTELHTIENEQPELVCEW